MIEFPPKPPNPPTTPSAPVAMSLYRIMTRARAGCTAVRLGCKFPKDVRGLFDLWGVPSDDCGHE